MTTDLAIPTIDTSKRVIQGEIVRCVDGRWSTRDGVEFTPKTQMLALGTTQAVQCWQDRMPVDTIVAMPGEDLPDVAELNAKVPESEWEPGIDGKPRPPWVLQYIAYLLHPTNASLYTFINSTTGARIAVERLQDRVKWMRAMRGDNVVPLVELSTRAMKTSFGTKQRPEFAVVEWRALGGGTSLVEQTAAPAIEHKPGKPVKPVTISEEMNDALPF
jgi:hypothetical protein